MRERENELTIDRNQINKHEIVEDVHYIYCHTPVCEHVRCEVITNLMMMMMCG